MRREASGDGSIEVSFGTSSSRDQVAVDAPAHSLQSSSLVQRGESSRHSSSGNLHNALGGGSDGRHPSSDQLSAALPSRQDTLSIGDVTTVYSPLSPAGSIHSVNSTAAFSVGQYRFSYCPICFEHFTVENPAMVLVCGHVFHAQCHLAWRDRSDTCAVCSAVIDDSKVRMMHGTDLHSRAGKGPVPPVVPAIPVPVAVSSGEECTPVKRQATAPPRSPIAQTTVVASPGGNAGRPVLVHVVNSHPDDDLDADVEPIPRLTRRTGDGGRGGLAGGMDDFLHTVQRAFACFRCGSRAQQRPQHPISSASSMTGGVAARRGAPSHISSAQIRGEVTPLRGDGSSAHHGAAAAAPYEEQERRMMAQKVQSSGGGTSA
jgi:hypothetical protein